MQSNHKNIIKINRMHKESRPLKTSDLQDQVNQICRNVGTVGSNMSYTRGNYAQHMESCVISAINSIILQDGAVAHLLGAK